MDGQLMKPSFEMIIVNAEPGANKGVDSSACSTSRWVVRAVSAHNWNDRVNCLMAAEKLSVSTKTGNVLDTFSVAA